LGTVGWARDRRDSLIYTTKGTLQRASAEVGLPGGDLTYYKLSYQHQWFRPLTRDFVLMLNGEIGAGEGYGGKSLPFYKNFFAGGVTSVRGYEASTLGPKDTNGDALGGSQRLVGNIELLFPVPGLSTEKSVRMGAFLDGGMVNDSFDTNEMRYSVGLTVSWVSPIGPLKVSFAQPLNDKPEDEVQQFQFTFGTAF
jgi:outer membrane protein insertion porin family